MTDGYDSPKEIYDEVVRDVMPKLTSDNVGTILSTVSMLVCIRKPEDRDINIVPRKILGMVPDSDLVVYGCSHSSRPGLYFFQEFDDLKTRLSDMIEGALADYDAIRDEVKSAPGTKQGTLEARASSFYNAQEVLADLLALREFSEAES